MTTEKSQKLAVLSVPEKGTKEVEIEEEEKEEGVEKKIVYGKHSVFHYSLEELEEGEEFVLIVEEGEEEEEKGKEKEGEGSDRGGERRRKRGGRVSYLSLEGVGTLKKKERRRGGGEVY